jgi:hypothetical protein
MLIKIILDMHCYDLNVPLHKGIVPSTSRYDVLAWASIYTTILARIALTLCPCISGSLFIVLGKLWDNVSVSILSNPIAEYPVGFVLLAMAPIVRIEPNGVHTLLLFDNA